MKCWILFKDLLCFTSGAVALSLELRALTRCIEFLLLGCYFPWTALSLLLYLLLHRCLPFLLRQLVFAFFKYIWPLARPNIAKRKPLLQKNHANFVNEWILPFWVSGHPTRVAEYESWFDIRGVCLWMSPMFPGTFPLLFAFWAISAALSSLDLIADIARVLSDLCDYAFRKDPPQTEGRRHAHPRIKTPPGLRKS